MPDPPIGRIGYVFSGDNGKTQDGRAEFFCMGCKSWQPMSFVCECGHVRSGFNKHIRTAQLDSHLAGYAQSAAREASTAPVTSDVNLPH